MKIIFLWVTLLMLPLFNIAQNSNTTAAPTVPEWVTLMYSNADDGAIVAAYKLYYTNHPFVKNQHTQYYKRWLHSIRNNAMSANNGSPITGQAKANWQTYQQKSNTLKMQKSATSAWVGIGPFDFDKESVSRSYAPGCAHIYTVEQSLSQPNILYAGTANAGLWKTIDKGLNWSCVTKNMIVNQVYAIEVDYTNPNTVYFCDSRLIYKSINGGTSFTATGDATFQAAVHSCNDIKMFPTNNQVIIAACDQGLFRTIDGGISWTTVQVGNWQELEFNPGNAQIVYAVKQINNVTEFYKSTDGGQTFTIRTPGWPAPISPDENKRCEIAVTPAAPNIIYCFATGNANGGTGLYGIYVSHSAGESWTFNCCGTGPGGAPVAGTNINMCGWADDGSDDGGQFYYDLALAVSTVDSNRVHVGAVNHWISTDGGVTFTCPSKWSHGGKVNYVHADIHDINYFGNELWIATDGGIFFSTNNGDTVNRRQYGIEGSDFWGYGVGFWDGDYTMVGGAYHNGTFIKQNNVYNNGWVSSMGGDNILGAVNYGKENSIYSDYGRHQLSGNRNVAFIGLANNKLPSSSYIIGEDAEMEFLASNYNTILMGNGNTIWKSKDGGANFDSLYAFGATDMVTSLELSADGATIICAIYPGWWSNKKLYKSTDYGVSFTEITPPATAFNSANLWAPFDIAIGDNPNHIWLVRTPQSSTYNNLNGYKVFNTTDGGITWNNLTTATLDGEYITNIVYKKGSNGGVYLGTRRAVYYRNNILTDWQLFNNSLPLSTLSTQLVINDKLGKIRNATNRSAFECDLYENNFAPIAQISVDKTASSCARDTFYFVDHSSLFNSAASWSWIFTGGVPATSNIRNPKVTYANSGTFAVSLTVTDVNGSNTQTIANFITISNACQVDTIPGNAIVLNGIDGSAAIEPLLLNSNTITMSAWVKPNGTQNDWAGVLFARGGNTTSGLSIKNDDEVRYHWDASKWSWSSGLKVIPNEWNHIALVVTPTDATIYVNGIGATNVSAHAVEEFDAPLMIGVDDNGGNRYFNGLIDETCIYNRSLSQKEIRELMHLTRKPNQDPSLIAYYQFNESNGNALDRSKAHHATLSSSILRSPSTAPLGGGTSYTLAINGAGIQPFTGTQLTATTPAAGPYANGDMVATRINLQPDQSPASATSRSYWILNNYGSNATFSAFSQLLFQNTGSISSADVSNANTFKLYSRAWNADGNTWGTPKGSAVSAVAGNDGQVTFDATCNVTNQGQYIITNEGGTSFTNVNQILFNNNESIKVYPTVVDRGGNIQVYHKNGQAMELTIFNDEGQVVKKINSVNFESLSVNGLAAGHYFYKVVSSNAIQHGQLVIQ
jgi:hypothetical protein